MISLFSFFLIGSFTHKYPATAGQRFLPAGLLSPFSFTPAPVNLCTMTIACKRSDCRQFFRFCFFRAGLTRQFVFKNFVLIFYYIIYPRVCQTIFRQIAQALQSATALFFLRFVSARRDNKKAAVSEDIGYSRKTDYIAQKRIGFVNFLLLAVGTVGNSHLCAQLVSGLER